MKTAWLLTLIIIFFGLRCSHDPLPRVCIDPIGSQTYTLARVKYNLMCYLPYNDTCVYNGCFQFRQFSSDPYVGSYDASSNTLHKNSCTIGNLIDVGKVRCLSDVITKPLTGYADSAKAILHHGYVFQFPDQSYGRFFIEAMYPSSGVIDSLYIIRQYPFE